MFLTDSLDIIRQSDWPNVYVFLVGAFFFVLGLGAGFANGVTSWSKVSTEKAAELRETKDALRDRTSELIGERADRAAVEAARRVRAEDVQRKIFDLSASVDGLAEEGDRGLS